MRQASLMLLAVVAGICIAAPDPLITGGPVLFPRDDDPQLVGYIESNTADIRTCDYTAAFSSSGAYAQCCLTGSSACKFFTGCTSNTLFGPSGSVACDYTSASTCNTAVVVTSAGAESGLQFLGCWQTDLGSGAFTIVRDTAAAAAPSSGAASSDESAALTQISATASPSSFPTKSGSSTASAASPTGAGNAVAPALGHLGALAIAAVLV